MAGGNKAAKGQYPRERRERMARAIQLREQGATYEQISTTLGVSKKRAYEDVRDALKEITREPAEDLFKIELQRLDRLWQVAFKAALSGDMTAMDRAIKLIDRRAKLLGLDAPKELKINAENVDLDATVGRLLRVAEMALQDTPALDGEEGEE